MRKGIVMDKTDDYLVVLSPDGSFHKAKKTSNSNAVIGEEIEFKPYSKPSFTWIHSFFRFRYVSVATAALLLAFVPMVMFNDTEEAYAYVNIDINPSVELAVNRDLEVIEITGLNSDGDTIIKQISQWEKQSVEKVTHLIIQKTRELGFMQDDRDVLIGVSYIDENVKNGEITDKIQLYVNGQDEEEQSVTTFEVPIDIHEKAKEEERSMNFVYAEELIIEEDILEEEEVNPENKVVNVENEEPETIDAELKLIEEFIDHVDENNIELPPGIAKKLEGYHEKFKDGKKPGKGNNKNNLPPGLEKKNENEKGNNGNKPLPPGIDKKDGDLPPGLENKKDGDLPPGIEKKLEENLPPGLQNKLEENLPPGIKKKLEEELPPGLRKKLEENLPPGLEKKLNKIQGQASEFIQENENVMTHFLDKLPHSSDGSLYY